MIVPELVQRRWYHYLMFSHTATLLKMMLLFRGGPQVMIVNAPWYLRDHAGRRPSRRRRPAAPGEVPLAVRTDEG